MRFVYIDSQGKEVSIPTVEALALRIELGAITEATRFYDEAADRWAPAGEHEIFRSLARELADKSGGFVAPPPPTPAAPPSPAASAPPAPLQRAPNPFEALEGSGGEVEDVAPEAESKPAAVQPSAPAGSAEDLQGLDFGLTLEAVPEGDAAEPAATDRADADSFAIELSPVLPADEPAGLGGGAAPPEPAAEPAKKEEEVASFDFEGFGGMLADDDEDGDEEATGAPSAGSDMPLEGVLAASYDFSRQGQGPGVTDSPMDIEQPLSDLPLDDGGWKPAERMTMDVADRADEAGAAPPPERHGGGAADVEQTERPPRARPAPPPPARSIPAALVVGVLFVILVGGGWFGWSLFHSRPPAEVAVEEVDPPVTILPIAAALEPRMREITDSAKLDWIAALRIQLPAEKGLPVEPDREWLAGTYLADAGSFASVEQYWRALGGYLTDVQAREEAMFVAAYEARLDSARVSGPDAERMLNRAWAGFQAARPDQRVVYGQLRAVIDTASGLHEFLLANEDDIRYDPAGRDPILEAVPATAELGRDMWDRVDQITGSLDRLGALDRVSTDRLLELFLAKLETVAIR